MDRQKTLALIIAYYISKFDSIAYQRLGNGNKGRTHQMIADNLGVNVNTFRNMRDSFDPLHGHRAGWYQRPLLRSRSRVVEAFQDLSEESYYDLVRQLLSEKNFAWLQPALELLQNTAEDADEDGCASVILQRTITGAGAEEAFVKEHERSGRPVEGVLRDVRLHGQGYDFEILGCEGLYQVEVKGLDEDHGGISFTSKEWEVARQKASTYFLVVVRSVSSAPNFQFIQDPAAKLHASQYVYTTVQVKWNVSDSELTSERRVPGMES